MMMDFSSVFKGGGDADTVLDTSLPIAPSPQKKAPSSLQKRAQERALRMRKRREKRKTLSTQSSSSQGQSSVDAPLLTGISHHEESSSHPTTTTTRTTTDAKQSLQIYETSQSEVNTEDDDEPIAMKNWINSSLISLGIISSVEKPLVFGSACTKEQMHVMKAVHELVAQHRRQQSEYQQLTVENQKLEASKHVLQRRVTTLQSQLAVASQDRGVLENDLKCFKKKSKKTHTALNKSLNELQLRCVRTEHLQSTWKATIRKKEAEYLRLKERMQNLMKQKDRHIKKGIERAEQVPQNDFVPVGIAARRDRCAPGEELVASMQQQMDDRLNEVMSENESMRQSLNQLKSEVASAIRMQAKAREMFRRKARKQKEENGIRKVKEKILLLKKRSKKVDEKFDDVPNDDVQEENDDVQKLGEDEICLTDGAPFDMVRDDFEMQVRQRLTQLQNEAENLYKEEDLHDEKDDENDQDEEGIENDSELKETVQRLRSKLRMAKSVISEQDELIKRSLLHSVTMTNRRESLHSNVNDSKSFDNFEEEWEKNDYLEMQKRAVEEERAMLAKARDELNNGAVQLDAERMRFQREVCAARAEAFDFEKVRKEINEKNVEEKNDDGEANFSIHERVEAAKKAKKWALQQAKAARRRTLISPARRVAVESEDDDEDDITGISISDEDEFNENEEEMNLAISSSVRKEMLAKERAARRKTIVSNSPATLSSKERAARRRTIVRNSGKKKSKIPKISKNSRPPRSTKKSKISSTSTPKSEVFENDANASNLNTRHRGGIKFRTPTNDPHAVTPPSTTKGIYGRRSGVLSSIKTPASSARRRIHMTQVCAYTPIHDKKEFLKLPVPATPFTKALLENVTGVVSEK